MDPRNMISPQDKEVAKNEWNDTVAKIKSGDIVEPETQEAQLSKLFIELFGVVCDNCGYETIVDLAVPHSEGFYCTKCADKLL